MLGRLHNLSRDSEYTWPGALLAVLLLDLLRLAWDIIIGSKDTSVIGSYQPNMKDRDRTSNNLCKTSCNNKLGQIHCQTPF